MNETRNMEEMNVDSGWLKSEKKTFVHQRKLTATNCSRDLGKQVGQSAFIPEEMMPLTLLKTRYKHGACNERCCHALTASAFRLPVIW